MFIYQPTIKGYRMKPQYYIGEPVLSGGKVFYPLKMDSFGGFGRPPVRTVVDYYETRAEAETALNQKQGV